MIDPLLQSIVDTNRQENELINNHNQIKNLKKSIEEREDAIEQQKQLNKKLKIAINEENKARTGLENELEEASETLKKNESKLDIILEQKKSALRELSAIRKSVEKSSRDLEARTAKSQAVKDDCLERKKQNARLCSEIEKMERIQEELSAEVANERSLRYSIRHQMRDKMRESAEQIQNWIQVLEGQPMMEKTLEEQLKRIDQEIWSTNCETAAIENAQTQLEADVDQLNSRLLFIQTKIKDANTKKMENENALVEGREKSAKVNNYIKEYTKNNNNESPKWVRKGVWLSRLVEEISNTGGMWEQSTSADVRG
eukprot:GHVL01009807.1.p3 GENE.GHVL01009807.1~~GHVL01009807.1.p3  ORF type:complete len:314 (+),score=78.60 GHVL01009807.1:2295-3236(+)